MGLGLGTVIGFILIILILLIGNEVGQSYYRNYYRGHYYKLAAAKALELDKPLIVVGDPHNGKGSNFHGPAYGSGNFVIDISGCTKGICQDVIERNALDSFKIFEDNSCVIFVSCVLEYIDQKDIDATIKEMQRVAGSNDNIFVVTVGAFSWVSYFYLSDKTQKHRDVPQRIFITAPPEGGFKYQEFTQKQKRKI